MAIRKSTLFRRIKRQLKDELKKCIRHIDRALYAHYQRELAEYDYAAPAQISVVPLPSRKNQETLIGFYEQAGWEVQVRADSHGHKPRIIFVLS